MMSKRLSSILFSCLFSLSVSAQINTKRMMDIGKNAYFFEDYVLSIQYFNKVISAKPYMADPYFYRAVAKMSLEDFSGAEADCDLALERNPFIVEAYRCRGAARACLGKYDAAMADFDKGLEFEPKNKYLLLCKGSVYASEERWDTAVVAFSQLLKSYPTYKDAYLRRGHAYFSMGDTAKALADFDKLLSIDRFSPDGHAARGFVLNSMRQSEMGLLEMNEAIRLDPFCVNYYVNRGVVLSDMGDSTGALADYDHAIELDASCVPAFFNRALLRSHAGLKRLALEDYDEVVELDPSNYPAIYNRALLKRELKQYRSAVSDISKIIDEYPDFYPAYSIRSELRSLLNDRKGALDDYVKMTSLRNQMDEGDKKNNLNDNPAKRKKGEKLRNHNAMVVMDKQEEMRRLSYRNESRGHVQNVNFLVEFGNIVKLTPYPMANRSMGKNFVFDRRVEVLNGKSVYPQRLFLSCEEQRRSEEQLHACFARIERVTHELASDSSSNLFFSRALDYVSVSDFDGALDDLNAAITSDDKGLVWLFYFCRANVRYQRYLSEVELVCKGESSLPEGMDLSALGQVACDLVMKDYDQVKSLVPDFAPVWFNRGHVNARLQNYQEALADFSKAIALSPSFAEAYFNRGLTYIYLNEKEKGFSDLSKAGELGLYSSYNVMKRFSGK